MTTVKKLEIIALIQAFRKILRTDLVFRLENEERTTFGRAQERYQKRIELFFKKRVKEVTVASELTQEVFLRAFQARRSLKPGLDLGAWFGTIARRLWLDHLRRKENNVTFLAWTEDEESDGIEGARGASPHPEELLARAEIRTQVMRAFETLAPLQRKAALLKFLKGWTDLEIAETLRLSLPATKSLLFRARRKVQNSLTLQPASG